MATFASGCFWCTESDFDKVPGVLKTISGFTGGKEKNPTYRQVVSGETGHTEAVQVTYDPSQVSYEKLLDTYWRNVDPFDLAGQFCDRGTSYRPAIFTHSEKQQELALASRKQLNASGRFEQKIKLPVTPAGAFYPAEAKHQNFYKKNAFHYYRYRTGCGRDRRLQQIWGKSAS
ncbi:MAG: peptide-methionine (S)-S-oxide reductase MsrA [Pseudomonadota bacterium]